MKMMIMTMRMNVATANPQHPM